MTLIVNDAKKYIPKNQLEANNADGTPQFVGSQDYDIIGKDFTVTDDNQITFSDIDFDAQTAFSLGDKISYLKTTGGTTTQCYGYVGKVIDNVLDVYTAKTQASVVAPVIDHTFTTSDTISDLRRAKIDNPQGHPQVFSFDLTSAGGTITSDSGTVSGSTVGRFYMDGAHIYVHVESVTITTTGSPLQINFVLPFKDWTAVKLNANTPWIMTGTNSEVIIALVSNPSDVIIILQRITGNFGASVSTSGKISYLPLYE